MPWVEKRIKFCFVYCGPERCNCIQMVWEDDSVTAYEPDEKEVKEINNEN